MVQNAAMTATPSAPADRPTGERREFETHWRMNARTRAVLDTAIDAAMAARGGAPIDQVLDVGCGRQSNVVFPGARRVVGTDVDIEGLRANQTVDEAIEADIVATPIPELSVDAIACIYVLEHVPHPDRVFAKLARALRPGGVMVIAVPNVSAPKAAITRFTPLWFHKLVYVKLLGRNDPNVGDPFATVLDGAIRPDRLEDLAEVCGLDVLERIDFEDNKQQQLRQKFKLTGAPWRLVRSIGRGLTRGRMDPELSDVAFAFQRRSGEATGGLADALTRQP